MLRSGFLTAIKSVAMLSCLIALPAAEVAFAQNSEFPDLAPENPEFTQYLQEPEVCIIQAVEAGIDSGLVPEPFSLPQLPPRGIRVTATPPAYYDLRALNKLTPIRDQGSCGSCWSFASYGSLESSLMPGESLDFSENNLKNTHGFDISCCSGGNRTMSTAYLARWSGPVAEYNDPYNPGSCSSPVGVIAAKHVQEVIYLPTRASSLDNDALKQAVMTYGAVYTTYYHSDSYYKSSSRGYYYGGASGANHAVCIVGWDDSYSAANFLTPPPGNGAFLIRNSWGTWWGQSGYFWISYYDSKLGKSENAVFRAEPVNNFSRIYQYDTLGWISNSGYGTSTAWFANVFTAGATEPIAAASWYVPAPGSTYTLYLYVSPTSGPISSSGPAAMKSGTFDSAGYHTVRFDTPISVNAGQKFSVVVRSNTPGYGYPIPLERQYSGYASAARANPGESYMSSAGTSWTDTTSYYANTNVCLKAFAGGSAAPPQPKSGSLSVTPSTGFTSTGAEGGPFSPSSLTYTLSNTGDTSISWTASKTASWLTLGTTSGTLAAGASATLSVIINSGANNLAAANYTDTVTFANDTNGNGNTSRSVALIVNASTPSPGTLSVTPSGGLSSSGLVGGPFSPSSQSYTLTNSGGSSISWTASKAQGWVTLSPTGGILAAGATATVTASVNTTANGLVAGTYSDTVTFTNTTNGNGSTTRSIALTVNAVTPPPAGAYRIESASFAWIDPSAHTRISLVDNSAVSVGMPFSFTLYGKTYTMLFVGSNGLLSFGSGSVTSPYNVNIPYIYAPNAAIYPYWDDLNPGAGGAVRMGTVGTAPNRATVISWVGVSHKSNTAVKFSFQAILSEGTGDIVFQYLDVSPSNTTYGAGKSATIGIEDSTGKLACKHAYNAYGSVGNNTALRITNRP
ncbi:MAG: lectin like domain-containing protein [Armatimonadota bacterium]